MPTSQEQFDDAMYDFSMADYDTAIEKLEALLAEAPDHFDARLALGMAHCRQGDYAAAIREGHKAEELRPQEQLVHTNLSLFYMKAGDKKTAEHHGLQARIASWRNPDPSPLGAAGADDPELSLAQPAPPPMKFTGKLPDAPWKKNKPISGSRGVSEQGPVDPAGSEDGNDAAGESPSKPQT